jgi:hypothetical protein
MRTLSLARPWRFIALLAVVAVIAVSTLLVRGAANADARVAACGIPSSRTWLVFPMERARDFSEHFPGWSKGADELLTDQPALVVLSTGYKSPVSPQLLYDMCIAVGSSVDSVVHHYGWTRFDSVRPDLSRPAISLP